MYDSRIQECQEFRSLSSTARTLCKYLSQEFYFLLNFQPLEYLELFYTRTAEFTRIIKNAES